MKSSVSTEIEQSHRIRVLDGWRGVSILLVLVTHLFPLGPKALNLAAVTGGVGMSVFFCLSGFLITKFLLNHSSVLDFLIRRFCRIIPLAWLALPIGLWMANAGWSFLAPNALFYANLPPFWLVEGTAHYWSLCVELQFYVAVAAIFAVLGKRGLFALPIVCAGVTIGRIHYGEYSSVVTWFRIDEILSGATLALAYQGSLRAFAARFMQKLSPWILVPLLLASAHPSAGFLNYFRPYLAALLVGSSLYRPTTGFATAMRGSAIAYIAEISYALYVLHPILAMTWLGSGDTLVKYMKRPLLLVALVACAHVSTFWYERRFIELGKRLSTRLKASSLFGLRSGQSTGDSLT